MIADSALPVWSINPNWKNGITETLEWLSDVMRNSYGAEQVRALRLSPRRTFEVAFNPLDQERAFFDLWLSRLSSDEFMLPLWHDRGTLTADVVVGATFIPFDTTYREFVVGGMAILVGDDPFTFDKVVIEAISDAGITVTAGGVTQNWSIGGTSVHPLRRARLQDKSAAAAITSRLGEATLRFELNQANDIADEGTWDTLYGDYPVIVDEPNRRENLKLTFDGETVLIDNEAGLREMTDDAGRAFTMHTHLMMLVGRSEQWAFRQMLYRLRGQQGAVWLPTFNRDVELSRDRLATDALLDFKKIGYAYTGGVVDGRQDLLIDGTITRKITALGAAPSVAEERVTLDSALGTALPTGTFASFMDICRLATDAIQIDHITDSDGVAESNLSFRAFRDVRTAPDPINYPIPAAVTSADVCGIPAAEEAGCFAVPPTFEGWYYKVWVDIFNSNEGGEVRNDGDYNLDLNGGGVGSTITSNVEWINGRFGELTYYGIHTGAIWTIDVEGLPRPASWHLQEQHNILIRPAGNGLYNIPGLGFTIYIKHWTDGDVWTAVGGGAIGGAFPHEYYWDY
jgi:hypothetical protein